MSEQFLTIVDHPRLDDFQLMKTERLEVEWQTKNNILNYDLFLIKHM